jgi:hypothetical protein
MGAPGHPGAVPVADRRLNASEGAWPRPHRQQSMVLVPAFPLTSAACSPRVDGVFGCLWFVAASAHDIAEDLCTNGVAVTMLQRSPVVVNNIETANLAYAGYIDPTIPTELVDIRYGIALINPLRERASKQYHQFAKDLDSELLRGLAAAGLQLGDGIDGKGWLDLFLRTGGGYYLNKGASEMIVAGGDQSGPVRPRYRVRPEWCEVR